MLAGEFTSSPDEDSLTRGGRPYQADRDGSGDRQDCVERGADRCTGAAPPVDNPKEEELETLAK